MLEFKLSMDDFNRRPRRQKINLGDRPNASAPKPRQAPAVNSSNHEGGAVKVPKKPKFRFRLPKNKKEWIIAVSAAVVLLGGTGFALYWFVFKPEPAPVVYQEPEPEPEPEPVPTTVASKTTGNQVEPAINDRAIYAVQIENSPEARPQSGLIYADIINEAVAEGGITRFNAIFHDHVPPNIGPIRSLRPYYIDWFLPYSAGIVHAGGSPEALADVRNLNIQDMDHGVNGAYFRRVSNRYAPHNLYSTGQQLLDLFAKRGYSNPNVASLPRKELAPAATPTARVVNLKISSANYNVNFTYDPATNTYLRSMGGVPHKDAEAGTQIMPRVVVVPVLNKSIHPNRIHTVYGTVGSGKVFVFQDGTVTEGTWSKPSRSAQWQLTDTAGTIIKLNPGQTWFTIIDAAGSVSYSP